MDQAEITSWAGLIGAQPGMGRDAVLAAHHRRGRSKPLLELLSALQDGSERSLGRVIQIC
jgi:hypothetical protein